MSSGRMKNRLKEKYMNIRDNRDDLRDLERAVELLTSPPVIIKISNAVGSTVEEGIKKLPSKVKDGIQDATKGALLKSIEVAEKTLESKTQEAWPTSHMLAVAATGAVSGFFGFGSLLLEIPVTTTVMMRSILDIARSEGHDLTKRRIQLECLSVFGQGSQQTTKDDGIDTGYFAARAAMTELVAEAAKTLSKSAIEASAKGMTSTVAGQMLAKFIEFLAARYSIVITEKVVLQSAPVVGAFAGAALNSLFMDFYQDIARGHFIMLRLEQCYGKEAIQQEFKLIQQQKLNPA
jgi:hypothetical protein